VQDFFEGYEDPSAVSQDPTSFNVLLIEDNAHDEFLFRKVLEGCAQSISVYVIRDGEEALNFFQVSSSAQLVFRPNIIFLDLNLPHLRGLDLLNKIKNRPLWNTIPIIVLTNSVNSDDVTRAYQLHANGFIHKSFNFEHFQNDLLKAVNYWLNTVALPSKSQETAAHA
jgi:CheY-like chemotaxis protein